MTAPLDEARLRELAEAATPGPWEAKGLPYKRYDDPCIFSVPTGLYVAQTTYDSLSNTEEHDVDADTAFIAAANPATVLALLDALSAERERADRAVGLLRRIAETPSAEYDDAKEADIIRAFLATQSTSRTGEG